MTSSARAAPARRSQESRSAATRERLLDATIECLIELGYGSTTTTEVVRRAGVSRGAQVHHFPTKADLVQNAVIHLAHRRQEELTKELARLRSERDHVSLTVDLLWAGYAGPLFTAALELIVAARTDRALRPALEALLTGIKKGIEKTCRDTFGPQAIKRASFRDALELTTNMMHGLALVRLLDGSSRSEVRLLELWKDLVRPLLEDCESSD